VSNGARFPHQFGSLRSKCSAATQIVGTEGSNPLSSTGESVISRIRVAVGLDINTAPAAELKAIPGIGDVYSAKIIAGRPYKMKDQLVSRKIIPQATYDKIKEKIVAKQPKS